MRKTVKNNRKNYREVGMRMEWHKSNSLKLQDHDALAVVSAQYLRIAQANPPRSFGASGVLRPHPNIIYDIGCLNSIYGMRVGFFGGVLKNGLIPTRNCRLCVLPVAMGVHIPW